MAAEIFDGPHGAPGWSQPYDGREPFEFHLKHGYSASQAVKDFLAGPTVADYRVIGVALEMDEVRDDIGDRKFDQLFGSKHGDEDAAIERMYRERGKLSTVGPLE